MHQTKIIYAGQELSKAGRAVIMVHGRGGSAEDILSLSDHLHLDGYALLAPQATNHSWYPQSFLAPPAANEPWLSGAIQVLNEVVSGITAAGIPASNIFFVGFSQGACLTLEFAARNAMKYGGVVAFTGGLIGDRIYSEHYKGDFAGTQVLIGTSDPDPHVPVQRVYASTNILKGMHAEVTEKVYLNMGHTISRAEIDEANRLIFDPAALFVTKA